MAVEEKEHANGGHVLFFYGIQSKSDEFIYLSKWTSIQVSIKQIKISEGGVCSDDIERLCRRS